MAIDKKRLNRFKKDIAGLQKELSFKEYNRTIQAKLLDYVSRTENIKQLRLREWENAVRPFFHGEYIKYVVETISKTYDVLDAVNYHYDDMGVDIQKDFDEIRVIEKVLESKFGVYESNAIHHIAKVLREGAVEDWDHKTLTRKLKGNCEKVDFYADTLARTGIKGISQSAKNEKARIGEIFWYEYAGIIRATSRVFCIAMIGQTRHIDIIGQMDNGQIRPVRIYRGGYNCHHDLEPDPFYKPPDNWRTKIKWQTVPLYKSKKLKYTLKK